MIHVVTAENIASYRDAMEQAYRLRHDVFVDELGWTRSQTGRWPGDRSVRRQPCGSHALHRGRSCARLSAAVAIAASAPVCRTCCGICAMTSFRSAPRSGSGRGTASLRAAAIAAGMLSPVGNLLLSSIVEWGLDNGVSKIIIEMNPIWLLRLVPAAFPSRSARHSSASRQGQYRRRHRAHSIAARWHGFAKRAATNAK